MATPGVKYPKEEEDAGDEELEEGDKTMFRALVARANYIAQDRTDIRFATKELSRRMANPRRKDMRALKRLGQVSHRQGESSHHHQEAEQEGANRCMG